MSQAAQFATLELIHPAPVTTLAFHPDGLFLATGCADQRARLFAVAAGEGTPLWAPVPHLQATDGAVWFPVFFAAPLFVDGGRELITYGGPSGLVLRKIDTGAEVRTMDVPASPKGIASIALGPDGRISRSSTFK